YPRRRLRPTDRLAIRVPAVEPHGTERLAEIDRAEERTLPPLLRPHQLRAAVAEGARGPQLVEDRVGVQAIEALEEHEHLVGEAIGLVLVHAVGDHAVGLDPLRDLDPECRVLARPARATPRHQSATWSMRVAMSTTFGPASSPTSVISQR